MKFHTFMLEQNFFLEEERKSLFQLFKKRKSERIKIKDKLSLLSHPIFHLHEIEEGIFHFVFEFEKPELGFIQRHLNCFYDKNQSLFFVEDESFLFSDFKNTPLYKHLHFITDSETLSTITTPEPLIQKLLIQKNS